MAQGITYGAAKTKQDMRKHTTQSSLGIIRLS